MASNNTDDEKPNLRPIKHITASGKSLFLHYNPNHPSDKSYIHATQNNPDKQDPFGIQEPHVEYSLNKQKRWKILNNLHRGIADQSDSSSDNDFDTQSDSEQRRNIHQTTKYRLYQFHTIKQKANCIGITSNTGQQRLQTPRKTYMHGSIDTIKKTEQNAADDEDNADVIYFAVVPPPREKQLVNIRKHYGAKNKKTTSSTQRHKFSKFEEKVDVSEDENENFSTDEDESITSYYTSSKPSKLQLNDFIPITTIDDKNDTSSNTMRKTDRNDNNSPKQKLRFYRQISKEEKLYNRDMSTYLKTQQENGESIKPKEKSPHYLMPLSYQSVLLYQPDFTIENLSKIYGKNFLHSQCSPTKYLICLTDRLKSISWSNKPELFSIYSTLNCYLIIILNDELNPQENICQSQIALNMDLYADTIQIDNISESMYKLDELINKIIEFITKLSFDMFKPIDSEINHRKFHQNKLTDNELSENEFINKQIHEIQLLDKQDLQIKLTNEEIISIDNNYLIRPDICTNCYSDMNELIPMTALKSCGHWLCNQCWKQYLENSIKRIKIILCPEWNCCSIVDVGTILSLVNVRCMNIYERNIEKCLVNVSRSYVKCPLKSCSNIVQVIGSGIDNVRCRCGHQFCIDCKQEPHFPATCTSYRAYIDEAQKHGDLITDLNAKYMVQGRNCISCNEFIEKNGGCNHMTCRCGAEFCWLCTARWKAHYSPTLGFFCPSDRVSIQKKMITRTRNSSRSLYEYAIYHRHERTFQNQVKQNENAKRLIGTIPLDKTTVFDTSLIKSQVDKRQALLQHSYEMVKYINYLHRICEFIAVAADGYANNRIEFSKSLSPLETILLNLSQILEGGRGYQAIEQLNNLHKKSEKLIERIHQAVIRRRLNSNGYMTS